MTARSRLAALIGAALALAVCLGACRAGPARMVDIGTHRLQMRQDGKGTPAVVIDAGLADQMDKLRPFQDMLAGITQVITYNRAGYGRSEPGPLPRDSGREADELKSLLEKASIPGPYVLVGHSLGALNVQAFASRHPHLVAGMVLLDPPPLSFIRGHEWDGLREMAERMTAAWQAIADSAADSAGAQGKAQGAFFRMIASEHREMFGRSARLVAGISGLGDTPLVVIASGKPNPAFADSAAAFQQYWVEQSRALAHKSTRGSFILAEGASHFLYVDVPELVAGSVRTIVQEARAR